MLVRMLTPLCCRALYSKAGQLVLMSQMAVRDSRLGPAISPRARPRARPRDRVHIMHSHAPPRPRMHSQVRYLAELGPEIVLPPLQVRLCDGLQAVTAIHQTPMALQTLALLAPALLDLSTAPKHDLGATGAPASPPVVVGRAIAGGPRAMHEALQLALPGIDANDLDKTASTLRLFQQACARTPPPPPTLPCPLTALPRPLTALPCPSSHSSSSSCRSLRPAGTTPRAASRPLPPPRPPPPPLPWSGRRARSWRRLACLPARRRPRRCGRRATRRASRRSRSRRARRRR